MEFLRAGHDGTNHTDVLRWLLQPLQQSRKRLGNHSFRSLGSASRTIAFWLRGLVKWKSSLDHRKFGVRAMLHWIIWVLSDSNRLKSIAAIIFIFDHDSKGSYRRKIYLAEFGTFTFQIKKSMFSCIWLNTSILITMVSFYRTTTIFKFVFNSRIKF